MQKITTMLMAVLCWCACCLLVGCFTTIPLGDQGKYGSVKIDIQYSPPVNLWEPAPSFLKDK